MNAFETLAATAGEHHQQIFREYRQNLVSIRGNLSSGSLAEYMDLSVPKGASPHKSRSSKAAHAAQDTTISLDTSESLELTPPLIAATASTDLTLRSPLNPEDEVIEGELVRDETWQEDTSDDILEPITEADTDPIKQIYIARAGRALDYGFIFTPAGTTKIIQHLRDKTTLSLYTDLSTDFLFATTQKQQIWHDAKASLQKRLIAKDLQQLIRKTDVQYRTHGDRMHYLVLGKVVTTKKIGKKIERKVYPLLLFALEQTDAKRLSVTVETTGFLNFWLDQEIFGCELAKLLGGGLEIAIDDTLPSKLQTLQTEIAKLTLSDYDTVSLDPDFSLLGIITGFETEYVDKAWGKIL